MLLNPIRYYRNGITQSRPICEVTCAAQLSEHTVKNYLFHIFDKLDVSSRVELILYAVSSSKRMQIGADDSEDGDNEAADAEGYKEARRAS